MASYDFISSVVSYRRIFKLRKHITNFYRGEKDKNYTPTYRISIFDISTLLVSLSSRIKNIKVKLQITPPNG